jgi:hypothetical protein
MKNSKDEEIRPERFTWNAGEFKFLTPEENRKRIEAKKAAEEKDNK